MKNNPSKIPSEYASLLRRVKETLLEGQRRIESERVRTYWETGRIIHRHILQHKDRADYGSQLIDKIANDLNVEHTLIKRCVKFARQYPRLPIGARGHQLGWSHYRQLITIPDGKRRQLVERRSVVNDWTAKELSEQIKETKAKSASSPLSKSGAQENRGARELLKPLRGELYTYRVIKRPTVGAGEDSGLLIDLGFGIYSRHTLRLRGIDTPEMTTKEGESARAFVQSYIKEAQMIVVRSSRSDKYDRYLADVFLPAPTAEGKDVYLNNLLLENGFAVRM
ncbi:MAG: thermonuclease family protein [Candidatus Omnitrophica bacterium]|nr:thermonuclease family protein [Candidatus Omnitrophota bacterium]